MKKNDEQKAEYARLVVQGMEKKEAYRKAFNVSGKSDAAVRMAISRLLQDVTVLKMMEELKREADEGAVMGRREVLERLTAMAREAQEEGERKEAVACIQEINKMTGGYAAEKVEAKVETCSFENILAIIEERKKQRGD